jgi:hypothetical protein
LAPIHRNQVRHELSCHCQRRAIGVAFLLFPVIEHRQDGLFRGTILAVPIKTVCRCLLPCFESGVRWMMFAELLSARHSPE